jgi:hypothetical protein
LVKSLKSFVRPLAFLAFAAVTFGACDEQLNGGNACPSLCPNPHAQLRDTTFFAISLDTTVIGFPALGAESQFVVAQMADTLQTGAVFRFDSLPNVFRRVNTVTDSVIVSVDSAYLRLTIVTGDTLGLATTVDVYDVDMDGAEESDPTAVTSVFTADRLLGSRTIPADSLRDSLRIPLDNAKLLAKIQIADSTRRRVRLGVRLRDGGARKMRIQALNPDPDVLGDGGAITQLVFRPSADTSVPKIVLSNVSRTPADLPVFAFDYADYPVIFQAPPEPPAGVLRVGGLPGRRAYMKFDIPSSILDSSSVVRATLQLTQRPARFSPDARDTVRIDQYGVVASPAITDLSRALLFIDQLRPDSLRVVPADSGLHEFEVISWVRIWKGTKESKTPRALAFALRREAKVASVVDFFSIEAPVDVRPRLRLTYMPKSTTVVP